MAESDRGPGRPDPPDARRDLTLFTFSLKILSLFLSSSVSSSLVLSVSAFFKKIFQKIIEC